MSGGAGATDFITDASGVGFVAGNGGVGTKGQCSALVSRKKTGSSKVTNRDLRPLQVR